MVLLLCLFSQFTFVDVNQISGDEDIDTTFYQPTDPSLTIDSSDNLYLIYNENFENRLRLAILNKTDPESLWKRKFNILISSQWVNNIAIDRINCKKEIRGYDLL